MGFFRWLFGKPNKKSDHIETPQGAVPAKPAMGAIPLKDLRPLHLERYENQEVINETGSLTFFVDELQIGFKEFSHVGESVNLWIPKEHGDKVYIYHRNGPYGCLGIVPARYSNMLMSHLKKDMDYEAWIEEVTEDNCKVNIKLISEKKTRVRKTRKRVSSQQEKEMNVTQVMTSKKTLEDEIFRLVNNFELDSGCTVKTISIKHKRIEAGEMSRNGLDRVMVKVSLPEVE